VTRAVGSKAKWPRCYCGDSFSARPPQPRPGAFRPARTSAEPRNRVSRLQVRFLPPTPDIRTGSDHLVAPQSADDCFWDDSTSGPSDARRRFPQEVVRSFTINTLCGSPLHPTAVKCPTTQRSPQNSGSLRDALSGTAAAPTTRERRRRTTALRRKQTTACPSSERPRRHHSMAALPSAAESWRSLAVALLGHEQAHERQGGLTGASEKAAHKRPSTSL
jgi:hypothetical protein